MMTASAEGLVGVPFVAFEVEEDVYVRRAGRRSSRICQQLNRSEQGKPVLVPEKPLAAQ